MRGARGHIRAHFGTAGSALNVVCVCVLLSFCCSALAAGRALRNASAAAAPNSLAHDSLLTGFDKDFAELVLTRMLGFDVTYLSFGSFTTMYLALLAGECDVAITASQMCASARVPRMHRR